MPPITDADLKHFEGLVIKTAAIYAAQLGEDQEDVQQVLRVKVWRALLAFDPARSSQPRDRYVFSCVVNQIKDLKKKKARSLSALLIEDIAPSAGDLFNGVSRDRFEMAHLSADHDQTFSDIERVPPVVPDLTEDEELVILRLYAGYSPYEIRGELKFTKARMDATLRSLEAKLVAYRPEGIPVP